MPYALIIVGGALLVAGIRNTYGDLWTLVRGDFAGQNSYLTWLAVIAIVGGLGYIPKLKPLSIAFMTLLLLVILISRKGVFAQLQSFIQSGIPASSGSSSTMGVTPIQPLDTSTAYSGIGTAEQQISANLSGGIS